MRVFMIGLALSLWCCLVKSATVTTMPKFEDLYKKMATQLKLPNFKLDYVTSPSIRIPDRFVPTTDIQIKQSIQSSQKQGSKSIKQKMSNPPISQQDILKYLNQARTSPQSLVQPIKAQLARFKGNMQIEMAPRSYYNTNEGKGAWQEAIAYLEKKKPIAPLALHAGLSKASLEHVNDLAVNNLMGHTGSNGSSMSDRIRKYCNWKTGEIGENVAQEFPTQGRNHALQSVISLIIDDGVSNRGHRQSIFNPNFKFIGTASARSADYILTVINYSSQNLPDRGVEPPKNESPYTHNTATSGGMGGMGGMNANFGNFGFNSDDIGLGSFGDPWKVVAQSQQTSGGSGGRYVTSTSTSTSTQTTNGKTVTKITTTKIYSDGTKEVNVEEKRNF